MFKHLYKTFADRYYRGGSIYLYSDPHFGDLDCYRRRFGKDITEADVARLDQMQIDNINKTAFKNDTLIMLGDIGDLKCVAKLRVGYKVLVMGNHDKGETNYEKRDGNNLFDEVYPGKLYISDKIKLSHEPSPEDGIINLHGHDHAHNDGFCFAAEHIGYKPVCFKTITESGVLGKTKDYHRKTIDRATARKYGKAK